MNKTISLTFTVDETNLLLKALAKLPLEEVLTTFAKIRGAAEEQLKEPETGHKTVEVAETQSF